MNIGLVGVHAHRTTVNSYRYNFPCVCGHILPAIVLGVIRSWLDQRYLFLHILYGVSRRSKTTTFFSLKFVSGVVRFTYSGTELIV